MESRYKNLFKGIIITLLIILMLLLLSICGSGCRSTKESTRVETATAEAVTVTTQDVTSVDQQHIDHNFTLSLDSLELWLPVGQENLAYLLPDTAMTLAQPSARSSSNGRVPVLLKARRATLTSGTVAERTVVQTAQLQDSTSNSQDTTSQIQESSDVVAVAHPVPPWVYIVPAVILALVILYFIHRKVKQ
jgi:hypothetical protein